VTQQNAALVEESAAAAEAMKEQAHSLVSTVSVFKLSDNEARTAAPKAKASNQPINKAPALKRAA
jgi:methyl-accepting chemotaxis protein